MHAEKQYQCKDSQLNPHAHGCTFLKAYKYYTSTYAQPGSAWRPEIYHQVVQVLSDNAAKNAKKNRPEDRFFFWQPRLPYKITELTVSDVHSDFETETQISCCRCGPGHDYLQLVFRGGYQLATPAALYNAASTERIMHLLGGLIHGRIP